MPQKSPTLRDISRKTGFALSTVSLAMRNDPEIPPATRKLIQDAAEEIGYRKNPLVAANMSYVRSRKRVEDFSTIALISGRPISHEVPTLRGYFEGVKARAEELGYKIEEHVTEDYAKRPRRLNQVLRTRNIHGLVVFGQRLQDSDSIGIDWDKFAPATVGYNPLITNLHHSAEHLYQDIWHALEKIAELGYRKIGLVLPRQLSERTKHVTAAGYLSYASLHRPKIQSCPVCFVEGFKHNEEVSSQILSWRAACKPDAIICSGNQATSALVSAGIRIPEEVGLANLDCGDQTRMETNGIIQQWETIGAKAVDIVVGQLNRNERGLFSQPNSILTPGVWKEGLFTLKRVK